MNTSYIPSEIKIGSIFNSSWGYDQTNVDYYQVIKLLPKSVVVRKIKSSIKETGFMSGHSLPLPNSFIGEPTTKRIQSYTHVGVNQSSTEKSIYFKVNSYSIAYLKTDITKPDFTSWYA